MEINLTPQEAEKIAELCENPFHAQQLSNLLYGLLEDRENQDISKVEIINYDITINLI